MPGAAARVKSVSIVVPVFNEVENLEELDRRIREAGKTLGVPWEVVYVDDGSTDGSRELLARLVRANPRGRALFFRRNYGQTAAIAAGMDHSTGEVVVPMDADLQNDPADIPALLGKIAEGYDVVSGWRKDRHDPWLTRRLPSETANALISRLGGVPLHDYGCTLKAYRRSALEGVRLYGEMHRFIPIYASWTGARVTEMAVRHHARTRGVSKYGLSRTIKVLLDLVTVLFLGRFSAKPIYLFGGLGFSLLGAAGASFVALFLHKYAYGTPFVQSPFLLLTVLLVILGVQCVLLGILAEIGIRTYFESQGKTTYLVGERLNFPRPPR